MIWLASMLFFGRIPIGLAHIPSQLITAAGVACCRGDRREQPTINAPRPSPSARLAPHKATALKTSPACCVLCAAPPPAQPLRPSRSRPWCPCPRSRPGCPFAAPSLPSPAPCPLPAPNPRRGQQAQVGQWQSGSQRQRGTQGGSLAGAGAPSAGPWRLGCPGGGAALRGLRVYGCNESVYKCN